MIKIKPYTEIQQQDEFIKLYRFIAAKAMPFYPEDLFPERYFYPDGVTKTDLSDFKRGARTRTEKYKKLLKKYNMPEETKESNKKHNDAELAKRIIDANSPKLHDYLYKSKDSVHVKILSINMYAVFTFV